MLLLLYVIKNVSRAYSISTSNYSKVYSLSSADFLRVLATPLQVEQSLVFWTYVWVSIFSMKFAIGCLLTLARCYLKPLKALPMAIGYLLKHFRERCPNIFEKENNENELENQRNANFETMKGFSPYYHLSLPFSLLSTSVSCEHSVLCQPCWY
jgi:hypothetical protein